MKYIPPLNGDIGDLNRPYIDANPAYGIEGSIPPAPAIEYPMREILAVIEGAGIVPDGKDLTQLLQAITLIAEANTIDESMPTYVSTDVVWFVRPDGNDETAKAIVMTDVNGSENTDEKAFKTISAATNYFSSKYCLIKKGTITIKLGIAGTYTEPEPVLLEENGILYPEGLNRVNVGFRQRMRFTISGDKTNQTAYIWSVPADSTISSHTCNCGNWSLEGLSIVTTGVPAAYATHMNGRLWNVNVTSNGGSALVSNANMNVVGSCNIVSNSGKGTVAFHSSGKNSSVVFGDGATSEPATIII